jgi:hypothetical protein
MLLVVLVVLFSLHTTVAMTQTKTKPANTFKKIETGRKRVEESGVEE